MGFWLVSLSLGLGFTFKRSDLDPCPKAGVISKPKFLGFFMSSTCAGKMDQYMCQLENKYYYCI